MPRVNVMVIGAHGVVKNLLDLLTEGRTGPTYSWYPGDRLTLPPEDQAATLVLHDVASLSRDDQRRLFEHLGRTTWRHQVISTTASTLLPRIHAGTFAEMLYYRLNTVCLDLASS